MTVVWHCVCVLHISANHIEFGGAPLCQLFPLANIQCAWLWKNKQSPLMLNSNFDTCFDAQAWEVEKTSEAQPEMQRIWNKTRTLMQCSTWMSAYFKNSEIDLSNLSWCCSRFCSKLSRLLKMLDHHPYIFLPISLVQKMMELFKKSCP